MTKYRDPPLVGTDVGPQISEYLRSKCVERKRVTIIIGRFCLFAKMIGSIIKF